MSIAINRQRNDNSFRGIVIVIILFFIGFCGYSVVSDTTDYRSSRSCNHDWKYLSEQKIKRLYGKDMIQITWKCSKCGRTKQAPKNY